MRISQWWPLVQAETRSWLIEHNGEPLTPPIIADIMSAAGGATDSDWWDGNSPDGHTSLTGPWTGSRPQPTTSIQPKADIPAGAFRRSRVRQLIGYPMKFQGRNDPRQPAVHYQALRGSTTSTGEAIEGDLYRGRGGCLFKDAQGQQWWIMFAGQTHEEGDDAGSSRQGRILAVASLDEEEGQEVRVLASGVSEQKAREAFRQSPPGSFEEAVLLAARLDGEGG